VANILAAFAASPDKIIELCYVIRVLKATALLALLRYKVGVIPVIVACGAAGLLFNLLKPWLAQIGVFS